MVSPKINGASEHTNFMCRRRPVYTRRYHWTR